MASSFSAPSTQESLVNSGVPWTSDEIVQVPDANKAVFKIPFELWQRIFILSQSTGSWENILLASVCRFWREVSLGTPILWSVIKFRLDRFRPIGGDHLPSPELELLAIALTRSASIPIGLAIRNRPELSPPTAIAEESMMQHIARQLTPHMHRIKEMFVWARFGYSINALFQGLPERAPILQFLSLHTEIYISSSGRRSLTFNPGSPVESKLQVPSLTHIRIAAGAISPQCFPTWSSIRHVSISLYSYLSVAVIDPTELLDTLHKLPHLESLRLYGEALLATESDDELFRELMYPETSFELCHLKALMLDAVSANSVINLVHHLLAPRLRLVELFNIPFQPQWIQVFQFLTNFPILDTFGFNSVCAANLPSLFREMLRCKSLSVKDIAKCACNFCGGAVLREALAGLNHLDVSFHPLACPQLLALTISGENPPEWKLGVPESRVKQMIRTRGQAAAKREVSRLRKFCYSGHVNDVSAEDALWFHGNLKEVHFNLSDI